MKKSTFPKIKKKLISFLTDESGAITKESLLKLSVGATSLGAMAVLPDVNVANAGHTNNIGP
jgi:acyl carrier protein